MSLAPDTVPQVYNLFALGTGDTGTNTGTQAGSLLLLPPGKKALQVSMVTSATLTVKIQNSVDSVLWFDVLTATATAQNAIAELDSTVPYWRGNITAHTTSGTGTTPRITAAIAAMAPK